MVQSGPVTRAGVRLGTFGHPCCFGHGHRHFRYFAWYPWWYSYSYYPYYWSYYSPMANYGYSDADEAQSQAYNYDQQISNEIGQLQDEVESLREELRSRSIEAPAPPAASPTPTAASPGSRTPTVLVYRDGHTREITNYAIVGPTLWVLSEQRGQKVALAELDIPATIKTNDERGVEFQVPTSR
jgi:hypothetical protein